MGTIGTIFGHDWRDLWVRLERYEGTIGTISGHNWHDLRVKCLAQEHDTMSPARARTRTARSLVERTNHEATTPPFPFSEVRCNNHLTLYLNESTGLTGPALDRCKNYEIKKKN